MSNNSLFPINQADEYTVKLKAHEYYMRFKNLGLTHEKAQDAAHVLIMTLREQYNKINRDTPEEQQKARDRFDRLAKDLNDYFNGRHYVEININELAEAMHCKKSQVLIIYKTDK